jgi:hypothetical protein
VQGKKTDESDGNDERLKQFQDTFGFDSIALHKPAVVREYIRKHDLRGLLIKVRPPPPLHPRV